ncbi:hypothetical protein ABW20_dc0105156 [Dactylellina cionopaga]|nr:hypothetical protein ABW20_dc0105156 [Dactylellina cionopaga]
MGYENPIQYGQSFDCHDHGNASTGALHCDILPAIEFLDGFSQSATCYAFSNGCYLQSCSGSAGIFLCNKSTEGYVSINCHYLAKIAKEIYNNYIVRHQDQVVRLDFCRRLIPSDKMDNPKGQEYSGNSFRKKEFATQGGDDMWSLQINRTQLCYETQDEPRGFLDGLVRLGSWDNLVYR